MIDDKEKQIEKLGEFIAQSDCGKHHDCSRCAEKDYMFCQFQHIAAWLYDRNVRVISDGDVLLTKDEYDELLMDWSKKEQDVKRLLEKDVLDAIQEAYDKGRNETAKKILQAVDDESYGQTSAITRVLRKRYGIEVEE